jgi:nitroreductase
MFIKQEKEWIIMNETMKTILDRRSIRRFKDKPVGEKELELILESGRFAPSAMNQQPWHFTVVQGRELLDRINEVTKEAFAKSGNPHFEARSRSEGFSPFYHAPLFIIVSCDKKAIAPIHDGALALGNMFLAAKSLGVSSCWIHAMNFVLESETGYELRKELQIPEGYMPIGAGAFGYSLENNPEASPRKKDAVTYL